MITFAPSLVIFSGPPFTGKSTLARALASASNFVPFDCDIYRLAIVGHDRALPDTQEAEVMMESYRRMHADGLSSLSGHAPVALAATYWRPMYKPLLAALLAQITAPVSVFELWTDDRHIAARIHARVVEGDPSEIKTMAQYVAVRDAIDPIAFRGKRSLDTAKPLPETMAEVLSHLEALRQR